MDLPDIPAPPEDVSAAPAPTEAQSPPPKRASQPKTAAHPAPAGGTDSSPAGDQTHWGTGRRKEAIARVRLLPGTGQISVNRQLYDQYFARETLRLAIRQPLIVTHQLGKCDVVAKVEGGGIAGQAGAVRLGIARALLKLDPSLRTPLRGAGLLTRDPRAKERKKYGQKGARARFQFSKR